MAVIGDYLYILDVVGTLFRYDANWQQCGYTSGYSSMTANGSTLYLVSGSTLTLLDAELNRVSALTLPYTPTALSVGKGGNELWIGNDDGLHGISLAGSEPSIIEEKINIDAQSVETSYALTFAHDRLYTTTGGPFRTLTKGPGHASILIDGSWTNYDYSSTSLTSDQFRQLQAIEASPGDPDHFVIGLYRQGLVEFRDGTFYQHIGSEDGYLDSSSGSNKNDYIWASDLKFDASGNLWVLNANVEYPVRVREAATGKWYKYNVTDYVKTDELMSFLITTNGRSNQKWFTTQQSRQTVNVFDDNGTLDNTADDQSICITTLIDQDGNEYSSSTATKSYALAEDKDGKIWLGTSTGIFTFSSPHNVFSTGGQCSRPKVPRNDGTGLADYLLDGETVTCIKVDAANRKWVGTQSSGVYLLSADGLETLLHFTSSNSMLPSDEVISMAIDDNTGRVYFGCSDGLAAYQSDATKGADDYAEVYAYPNPVRPDYTGTITVCGLMANTLVKITDLNNNLICQGTSLGGQFSWDGLNRRGERVKSGVYLVYGSSEDGKKGVVTKIMIIR